MATKRNRKQKRIFHRDIGKHLSAKTKLRASRSADLQGRTVGLVNHGGNDDLTPRNSGVDVLPRAGMVEAAANQQAEYLNSQLVAQPSASTDDRAQETQPAEQLMRVHPLAEIF